MFGPMFAVTLTCSDQDCAFEVVKPVTSLDAVEPLVCDGCGCCLQAVGYAEAVEVRPIAPVVPALLA